MKYIQFCLMDQSDEDAPKCPHCGKPLPPDDDDSAELFRDMLPKDLTAMVKAAGLDLGGLPAPAVAKDVEGQFKTCLKRLQQSPEEFSRYVPKRGHSTYEHALYFVKNCLRGCQLYPYAEVLVLK